MNTKDLKIKILTEKLEKITGKTVVLKEGTWGAPDTPENKKLAKLALEELSAWQTKYSKILGDDDLFDGIDSAIRRGKEMIKTEWAPKKQKNTF